MATDDPSSLDLRGPQWLFAVGLYQKPGVSEACLILQDALSVDVCLLLFALFAAKEYRVAPDKQVLEDFDQAIAEWRDNVVRPLRAIRRRLKIEPPPGSGSAAHALREQIKKSELDAEQIQLAMLARHFQGRLRAVSTASVDIRAVLEGIAKYFAVQSGNPAAWQAPETRSALRDIAAAMDGAIRRS